MPTSAQLSIPVTFHLQVLSAAGKAVIGAACAPSVFVLPKATNETERLQQAAAAAATGSSGDDSSDSDGEGEQAPIELASNFSLIPRFTSNTELHSTDGDVCFPAAGTGAADGWCKHKPMDDEEMLFEQVKMTTAATKEATNPDSDSPDKSRAHKLHNTL